MSELKLNFYTTENIDKFNATYNVIFGERSNGKTYAVLLNKIIKNYIEHGKQGAYMRRWSEDFKGNRARQLFQPIVKNGELFKLTKGHWTDITYQSMQWWLCRYDEKLDTIIKDVKPFCFGYAISSMEHDKGTSDPDITTIVFDEFLSRSAYLPDEFVLFMNTVSTIVRYRDDVKIYMLGNTVSKYCPYFSEMGLNHIKDMKAGAIDIYTYGESKLRVAVEFADSLNKKGKPSDLYFAFDNPRLKMITGGEGGSWEMALYPHCPQKFQDNQIIFTYFISFNDELLQCEIVHTGDTLFTFIHKKTTELKDTNNDVIFSPLYDSRPNWRRKINSPLTNLDKKIAYFFANDKVFYQSNEVGEIVRAYLQWCQKN